VPFNYLHFKYVACLNKVEGNNVLNVKKFLTDIPLFQWIFQKKEPNEKEFFFTWIGNIYLHKTIYVCFPFKMIRFFCKLPIEKMHFLNQKCIKNIFNNVLPQTMRNYFNLKWCMWLSWRPSKRHTDTIFLRLKDEQVFTFPKWNH